jgi:hypothetical protein
VHRKRSGKQSSSSWYQSARLITVQIDLSVEFLVCVDRELFRQIGFSDTRVVRGGGILRSESVLEIVDRFRESNQSKACLIRVTYPDPIAACRKKGETKQSARRLAPQETRDCPAPALLARSPLVRRQTRSVPGMGQPIACEGTDRQRLVLFGCPRRSHLGKEREGKRK